MKKMIGLFVFVLSLVVIGLPAVQADSAISADEQRILDSLNTGVTVSGKTFYLDASDLTQAENYLKQNDLSAAEVNEVVASIESAKALVASQTIDVTNITTLAQLMSALPANVKNQIRGHITNAANVLGLTISLDSVNSYSITDKKGHVAYATGSPVKNTGSTYLVSVATIAGLLTIAAGAFVVGRKVRVA